MSEEKHICIFCRYAGMRRDICGIYCTGGFENAEGMCNYFKPYERKTEMEAHP